MDRIKALLIFMGITIEKGTLDPQMTMKIITMMIMMTMIMTTMMIMDMKMINPNFL